jgi:transcription antitermination factor NusG
MRRETDKHSWYAIQVKSRFEKVVAQHLRGKGYEEYLPLYVSRRRWSDRIKEIEIPLFPGYTFCRFDVTDRLPIVLIPGVISVVSFGGIAQAIPEDEIVALQNVVRSGASYEPWPFIGVGQKVQVTRGPLAGLEGVIVETRKNYLSASYLFSKQG